MATLFVTVGTTCFPGLISQVHRPEFYKILKNLGFSKVILQHGSSPLPPLDLSEVPRGLTLESYAYKPSLGPDFEAAFAIISHAGTGCILEALELNKPLLVIVNQSLMDNHQLELASELASRGYLVMGYPETLKEDFEQFWNQMSKGIHRRGWDEKVSGSVVSGIVKAELGL